MKVLKNGNRKQDVGLVLLGIGDAKACALGVQEKLCQRKI